MSPKKISSILSLIEISQNNLKTAKEQLMEYMQQKNGEVEMTPIKKVVNPEEYSALEVVEGYFDGESMVGDNGKIYTVPPNYASKTQLIIGDRMKRILTQDRESYKLIKPAERDRVIGTFDIQGDDYLVHVPEIASPVRILKASATFAMKNLGMQPGDKVAIVIPRDVEATWGALSSVVSGEETETNQAKPKETQYEKAPASQFDPANYFDAGDSDYL